MLVVVVDLQNILNAESCIMANESRVWGDVREDRKEEFVRELENCKKGMRWVSFRSKGLIRELVLRLVWGAGDPRDFDNGITTGRCFLPRPDVSLAKNPEVFS